MKKSLALIPSANAHTLPPAKPQPLPPGAKPIDPASTPAPAAVQTRRVKLNFVEKFYKNRPSEIRIFFDHSVYTAQNFPYPFTSQDGQLYAVIPVSDLPPEEPVQPVAEEESETPTVASADK